MVLSSALGCAGQTQSEPREQGLGADLPAWLVNVYPGPGAEMTSVSVVEVRHKVFGRHQGVRLVIDGVDVTRSSTLTRGRLHFDPERAPIAVELDSGVHHAVVRRVELPRVGDKHRVVGSYEWSFTVL